MSKELSNREQKFRDEYMDILYQAIRKEHPPGKYLLLDKDDLRKLTELFKRVYQEGEYIDMNDIKEFLTKEHKELIHKKIVKTIEDMDFTSIIEDFINDELDYVRDQDNVDEFLEEQIIEIVRTISEELSIHDFRVVFGNTHSNLLFDITVPFSFSMNDKELCHVIDQKVKQIDETYNTVITVDRSYISTTTKNQ